MSAAFFRGYNANEDAMQNRAIRALEMQAYRDRVRDTVPGRAHLGIYRATRDRFLKGHRPAATLLIVAGLADERLVVEVDLVAAAGAAGPAT